MKRIWIVIIAVCAALAFTACGRAAGNTETAPAATEPVPAATEPVPSPAAAEPAATEPVTTPAATLEAPGNTAEFKILTGNVEAVSDTLEDMTVKNGSADVKFHLKGVAVVTSYALEAGTPVTVIYKGEISGNDSSNAKIVLVADAQENMEIHSMTGSVQDQAMSTFTIQDENGDETGFLKDNCEGLTDGVLGQARGDSNGSGVKVKVTYITVTYDADSESNFPLKVEAVE